MPDDTPLSQLVLWVPPEIAAGWERLPPGQQTPWTRHLVREWLQLITQPGPPPVLLNLRNLLPHDDFEALRRHLEAIPTSPSPPELPPLPDLPPVPTPPPPAATLEAWMSPEAEQHRETFYQDMRRHQQALGARLDALNARMDARLNGLQPGQAEDTR